MFDNLNQVGLGLEFLEALSAEELKKQIQSITLPTKIISIYAIGSRHIAWIQTTAKVQKIKKDKKEI